jgi:porin
MRIQVTILAGALWIALAAPPVQGEDQVHLDHAEEPAPLTATANAVYSFQGITHGGIARGADTGSVYSGNVNLFLDTSQSGLWEGGSLNVRLEGRGGEDVQRRAGVISPLNNQAFFPLVEGGRGGDVWALSELVYTQELNPGLSVFAGLLNTTSSDNNPLTGNAISNQHFMNMAFLYSPVEASLLPAVTLGGGVILRPAEGVKGTISAAGSEETAGYNPFSHYEGTTLATEWEWEYHAGGRPGGMVLGGLYSVGHLRQVIDESPRVVLTEFAHTGELPETDEDTWALFWNGFQYLVGDEEHGFGIFARLGLSEGGPNPVRWHSAAGFGGTALFPGRESDRWGFGVYQQKLSSAEPLTLLGVEEETGIESFYNLAINPHVGLTLDAQYIDSAFPGPGSVFVLGSRLNLSF